MDKFIALLQLRLASRASYRIDLLIGFLADVAMSGLGLILLFALFNHIDSIEGWDRGACLWLWGMAECSSGLAQCLFTGVMVANRSYLINGGLDRLLLRPIHPLIQLLTERLSGVGLSNTLIGLTMMILGQLEHPVALFNLLWIPLLILGGVALMGGLLISMSALGFVAHHTGTFSGLLLQAVSFSRYPLTIFPTPLRWALLPVGLLAYLPVGALLGHDTLAGWHLAQPLIGFGVLGISILWWNRLSRMYTSTGH